MLLRTYIRRVVKLSRGITPRERVVVTAFWKVGFGPKAAVGFIKRRGLWAAFKAPGEKE